MTTLKKTALAGAVAAVGLASTLAIRQMTGTQIAARDAGEVPEPAFFVAPMAVADGDWQNKGFLAVLQANDKGRWDVNKGLSSIDQTEYAVVRYGRQNHYLQLKRAIEERMSHFDSDFTNVAYVTRRNLLNLPVQPPPRTMNLEWWRTSGLNEFKDTDGTPVVYRSGYTYGSSARYGFGDIATLAYNRWFGRRDFHRITPSAELQRVANRCQSCKISFAAHPFGCVVFRDGEISEELAHMFNPHTKADGEAPGRTADIIADQLIWGEFVASFASLKAEAFRRGYDFGTAGEFDRFWTDFNDDNTFGRIVGHVPKEVTLLLASLIQAKQAIAAGTATQREINGVAWASSDSVGRMVL